MGPLRWPAPLARRYTGTTAGWSSPSADSRRKPRARRRAPRTCTNQPLACEPTGPARARRRQRRLPPKGDRRRRSPRERESGSVAAFVARFFCEHEELVENLLRQLVVFEQVALEIGDDELALALFVLRLVHEDGV